MSKELFCIWEVSYDSTGVLDVRLLIYISVSINTSVSISVYQYI